MDDSPIIDAHIRTVHLFVHIFDANVTPYMANLGKKLSLLRIWGSQFGDFYSNQVYSRPRIWRLLESWRILLKAPPETPRAPCQYGTEGVEGVAQWGPHHDDDEARSLFKQKSVSIICVYVLYVFITSERSEGSSY